MLVRDRNIRLPRVLEIAGLGKTQLYQLMRDDQFPQSRKLGNATVWSEVEVLAWQNRLFGREVPAALTLPDDPDCDADIDDLVGG